MGSPGKAVAGLVVLCAYMSTLQLASTQSVSVPDPLFPGREITPVDTSSLPKVGSSNQPDDLTIKPVDQVFSAKAPAGTIVAGANKGDPELDTTITPKDTPIAASVGATAAIGKKLARKMLQTPNILADEGLAPSQLQLAGTGTSIGDQTAGVTGTAYGHGESDGSTNTHILPHGAVGSATVLGQQVSNVGAAVNPDCTAGEGACVATGNQNGR